MARAAAWRCVAVATAFGVVASTATVGPAAATLDAADASTAAVIQRYRERIPQLMEEQGIPGLALAVVDGDQVLWAEGFGHTDTDRRIPVTADTMFSVQSTSKPVTATAVMQAVGAGQLDLDVPITTYLPDIAVQSAFEAHPERSITLRMLLSHTAGFTHEAPVGNNYERDPGTFDAHVRSISDTWLRFRVGTGYAYSNLGIDLAATILERTQGEPFATVVDESLFGPLGMRHSTFDRARVHAAADRAVGHGDPMVPMSPDSPMTGAGGLWASAGDLARFLRFQLGGGVVDGTTVLDPALVEEMRTIPAPHAGEPAGYALGVTRTRWRAMRHVDLFSHGGGGLGFLADLWWAPELQLGVTVLFNATNHDLHGTLALSILRDLVNEPGSPYRDRLEAIASQADVVEPDSHWVAPSDMAAQVEAAGMPPAADQPGRWAGYAGAYRSGSPGAMTPAIPASRFGIEDGSPYFEAAEDGTPIRHLLTEVRPGVFLAENGETLDLRGPRLLWRGINLVRVTEGPLAWQWALLAVSGAVAVAWFAGGALSLVRRRRRGTGGTRGRAGRRGRVVGGIASLAALTILGSIAIILLEPKLVDVGFLGWLLLPLPARLALHLPLALVGLAGALVALVALGWVRGWWTLRSEARLVAVTAAAAILAAQVTAWHLVGWGFG